MRAVLFHNPTAGPNELRNKDSILSALRLADLKVDYVSTKKDDLKQALQKSADFFIAAGGDGTVREVLTRMPDRSIPVAILPFGTANNIARSLGIGGSPHAIAESWQPDHTARFDIGTVEGLNGKGVNFAEGCGLALLPTLFERVSKKKKSEGAENLRLGREELQKIVKNAKPIELELTIDGASFDCEVLGVEVLNIPYTGPGLPLSSSANSGDGLLEVICIEPGQREAFIEWLDAPQKRPAPVTSRLGSVIELEWKDAPARVDDEVLSPKKGKNAVEITCERKPASVMLPKPSLQPAANLTENA